MIRYKVVEHERSEDAPFIGALISSIDCHNNCQNCFNQHIKKLPTKIKPAEEIVHEVLSNPFNEGIILAGLEWTEQPNEMLELLACAVNNNLKAILYTGMEENTFKAIFPDIYHMNIYIKFGRYIEDMKADNHYECGVKLASSNQHIRPMAHSINGGTTFEHSGSF